MAERTVLLDATITRERVPDLGAVRGGRRRVPSRDDESNHPVAVGRVSLPLRALLISPSPPVIAPSQLRLVE